MTLRSDLSQFIANSPVSHSGHATISRLAEIVERNQFFIRRYPTTLFQCLWNDGWWADSDQRSLHLRSSECGVDYSPGVSDEPLPTRMLAGVVENWRRIKNDTSPGFRWIRSLRPPQKGLGSACRSEVRGQLKYTSSIGCSGNGSIVAWVAEADPMSPRGRTSGFQKWGGSTSSLCDQHHSTSGLPPTVAGSRSPWARRQ